MFSIGQPLKNRKILEFSCVACFQGKFIVRSPPTKIGIEFLTFLKRIQGDICGSIHPPCGSIRYFIVLIDESTRWSHVCLLSTHNLIFARLLAQIIRLRPQFLDYAIKIRLDNSSEFTSQALIDYCMSIGIKIKYM